MAKHFKLGWARISSYQVSTLADLGAHDQLSDLDAMLLHVDSVSVASNQIDAVSKLGVPICLTARTPAIRDRKLLQQKQIRSLDGGLFRISHDTILMGSEGWPIPSPEWTYQALGIWLGLVSEGANHVLLASWGINLELREEVNKFCREHPEISVSVLCPEAGENCRIRPLKNLHVIQLEAPFPFFEVLHLPR